MYLPVVLLLAPLMVFGQPVSFTINSIELRALPSPSLRNGNHLQLKCLVAIAKSGDFELSRRFNFYKDDNLVYNVTTTNDQAIYLIQNASVSRSGLYKCKVIADSKQKTSEDIKVKITGLSAPLIGVSKMGVSEGEEITVRCEAPNEEPPMVFSFYKTVKERRDVKVKQSNANHAETTYEIKEGESILHFECSVKLVIQEEPESPESSRQTVAVVESFQTPVIKVRPSNNFTEGAVMTVTCTVHKSHMSSEKVTIILQKDNQILNTSDTGKLTYSQMADVSDTGNYTCKAEGRIASKATTAIIKVKELFPRPRLILKPTNNKTEYINDGDYVFLECSVSSLSLQETSTQEFHLMVNGQRKHTRRGGIFQRQLRATDSGDYKCGVTIANITKSSEKVEVKVYAAVAKPELRQIINNNKMVVLGDTLTLTCKSQSGTPPITYTLYREEKQLGKKEMMDNREAVFMVNTTKLHDLGQYRCHAANRNRNSRAFSEALNVTVIAPVSEVNLVIVPENGEVEEGAELSLVCSVENGTLPITFYFYVRRGSDLLLKNVTTTDSKSAQFMLPSFTKQQDGSYFCTASNKANKSTSSRSMQVKAVLARWKKAIIGGFVIVIMAAAIGIALYLYLDKRKKGKNISTNSSRSSKPVSSSSEKSAADVKNDDSYFGSVQNEEELHILKTAEENIGNNQQNHDVEYTEADGPAPDPHHDSVENNFNENSTTNNLT